MADAPISLNPAQLEAVFHLASPCLVLAGAGSGKTRVIVHKLAKLLQSDSSSANRRAGWGFAVAASLLDHAPPLLKRSALICIEQFVLGLN